MELDNNNNSDAVVNKYHVLWTPDERNTTHDMEDTACFQLWHNGPLWPSNPDWTTWCSKAGLERHTWVWKWALSLTSHVWFEKLTQPVYLISPCFKYLLLSPMLIDCCETERVHMDTVLSVSCCCCWLTLERPFISYAPICLHLVMWVFWILVLSLTIHALANAIFSSWATVSPSTNWKQ